ncbi:hypothetical protein PHJA_000166100 [Phtheirospermum japonicum]|uniref:Uncharacterized protein n=1 Tax=Phtheirospermum japonicum TaxID=374723 RepID=A0A830AZV2_9LAMI|nr:hypothetical protein PHJA_000166100 [Phtheirospermum japonicum]
MDTDQEEMQLLGLFGIYKESFKLIFKLRKIFSQITLTLILPLCFIFFAQEDVSDTLDQKIWRNKFELSDTELGTRKHHKLADLLSLQWAAYILLKIIYHVFVLAFSLLSTSAVVYAIACAYTSRDVTFMKIMSVVPRVWKRLIITFLCAFLAFAAYNFVFGLVLYLWRKSDYLILDSNFGVVVFVAVLVLYALGFVYMTIIWQLASVVSVMEDLKGIKAVGKGMRLMKGKVFVAVVIFVKLNVALVAIYCVFRVFVMSYGFYGFGRASVLEYVGFGALCLLVSMKVVLFGLVVQTVIYFVCKSCHRENIDKLALSEHLEVIYLGEYVPLKAAAKDVQMEEYRV